MTRQEWIEQDCSFYHITPTRNLESIYETGLINRNGQGICVVRTNHQLVIRFICEMMLTGDGDLDFSIIEIKPISIQLREDEILNDDVVEITNNLHNYIARDTIVINEENVIGTFQANPLGIPDLIVFENEILDSLQIERLD